MKLLVFGDSEIHRNEREETCLDKSSWPRFILHHGIIIDSSIIFKERSLLKSYMTQIHAIYPATEDSKR